MGHRISRRTFAIGIGTGAAAAALFLTTRESILLPIGMSEEDHPLADGCCMYSEYEGWLVTTADKRRLVFRRVDYDSGWYSIEENSGTHSRWTHQDASLSVVNPRAAATFFLDYSAHSHVFSDAPRVVTVSVGDKVLASFVADVQGRHVVRIPLLAGMLGDRNMAKIRIAVDRTFVPADVIEGLA